MTMAKLEKETIICFNEAEPEAEVFTYNGCMLRNLEKYAAERPDEARHIHDNGAGGMTYRVPKKWVKIRAGLNLTDEQRAARSERGRKAAINLRSSAEVPSVSTQQTFGV